MPARAARKRPVEYSILYTATLCLLAGGAVMVYSASSAESLLNGSGDPAFYLKRSVVFGVLGLVLLHAASRHGLSVIKAITPLLLGASFVLTVAGMLPGVGGGVNGAPGWLGARWALARAGRRRWAASGTRCCWSWGWRASSS